MEQSYYNNLPEVENTLRYIGINIRENKDKYKSFYEVIFILAQFFNDHENKDTKEYLIQKKYILESIVGARKSMCLNMMLEQIIK